MKKEAYLKLMSGTFLLKEAMASRIEGEHKPIKNIRYVNGVKYVNGIKQEQPIEAAPEASSKETPIKSMKRRSPLQIPDKPSALEPPKRRSFLE